MNSSDRTQLTCSHCELPVTQEDAFCPNCGSLFSVEPFCSIHRSMRAAGICVICAKPFCTRCGKETDRVFLCDAHWRYEIHEGMARVFGCTDNVQAQYVTRCLEQAGFHPFLYSRMFNPGADLVSIAGMVRNFGNHPIVELKVLVPFSELLKAVNLLKELGIAEEDGHGGT